MDEAWSYYFSGHHCGPHGVGQRRKLCQGPDVWPPAHDDLILATAQELAGLD